jgi:PH/SEC7 domain-containing protein
MLMMITLRRLCAKLYLKAETQQVDRILVQFSRRYFENNPTTLFGSASVVHAVSYSLLLLNTDLHVAELVQRMSRQQFVRNTLGTIHMQIHPERYGSGYGDGSTPDLTSDDSSSLRVSAAGTGSGTLPTPTSASIMGGEVMKSPKRSGSITSWNSVPRDPSTSTMGTGVGFVGEDGSAGGMTAVGQGQGTGTSTPRSPSIGNAMVYDKHWEVEMEATLKVNRSGSRQGTMTLIRGCRTYIMQSRASRSCSLWAV